MERDLKESLERINLMLEWLLWKFTDGELLKKLESIQLDDNSRGIYLKLSNKEPDISGIYEEIWKKKLKGE